jgi:DNA-binding Lrp family transcriptional regulator
MTDWIKVMSGGLADEIPEGWETTSQIAEHLGITPDAAHGRLKRRKIRGLVEQRHIIVSGMGKSSIWRVIDPEGGGESLNEKNPR